MKSVRRYEAADKQVKCIVYYLGRCKSRLRSLRRLKGRKPFGSKASQRITIDENLHGLQMQIKDQIYRDQIALRGALKEREKWR